MEQAIRSEFSGDIERGLLTIGTSQVRIEQKLLGRLLDHGQ